jgi:thiol:disulfide interchange protein
VITHSEKEQLQQQETDKQKDKVQQREAVENLHDNFLEPQLQTQIQVQHQSQSIQYETVVQTSPSVLLVLLLWFFCLGLHIRHLRRMNKEK